jgi:predicted PilT family ATPase
VYDNEGDSKEVLMIDPKFVGRIVGKGGETINSLQSEYNVKINIEKEEDDVSDSKLKETSAANNKKISFQDGKKKVEVCGSEDDVKKAIAAIQVKIAPSGGDGGKKNS